MFPPQHRILVTFIQIFKHLTRSILIFYVLAIGTAGFGQNYDKRISLELQFTPNSFMHGDLNNDSQDDLIMTFEEKDYISVRYKTSGDNYPDGYDAPRNYDLGSISQERFLLLEDINNDNLMDIIFTDPDRNRIGILKNNGNRQFFKPIFIEVNTYPRKVVSGDLNADGKNDLIVLYENLNLVTTLSDPSMEWVSPTAVELASGLQPIDAGITDLDEDGVVDLIIAHKGDNEVAIFYGYGTSSEQIVKHTTSSPPNNIEIAGLDADEVPDIAVANENNLQVLLLNQDRTLKEVLEFIVDGNLSKIDFLVTDLEGDLDRDVVIHGSSGTSETYLFFFINDGMGSFEHFTRNYNNVFNHPFFSLAYVDLADDGEKGFLYANKGSVIVNLTFHTSTFKRRAVRNYPVGSDINEFALGDINSDGILDMVVANRQYNYITIKLGAGDNTFVDHSNLASGRGTRKVKLIDLNLDGQLDIVAGGFDPSIFLNKGNSFFDRVPLEINSSNFNEDISVYDVNDDDYPDLLLDGSCYLSNNGESFTRSFTFNSSNTEANAFIHYDNDGQIDAVISDNGDLEIFVGDGSGTFERKTTLGTRGFGLEAIDINADGFEDLAVDGSSVTRTGAIYWGTADGFQNSFTSFSRNDFDAGMHFFDFDKNGSTDLVTVIDHDVVYYRVTPSGLGSRKRFPITNSGFYRDIYPFDYNRDGEMDVVITNHYEKVEILTRQKEEIALELRDQIYDGFPIDNLVSSNPAGLDYVAYYKGDLDLPTDVGEYPIIVYLQDDTYIGWLADTVTVSKAQIDVIAPDTTKHQYQKNPIFKLRYDEFLGDDTESDIDFPPSILTDATKDSEMGTYAIILSGGSDNNYELNLSNGTLTILEPLNVSLATTIRYYPNPVHDFVTIDDLSYEVTSMKVSDFQGKVLETKNGLENDDSIHIDLSKQTSGIYFITLKYIDGRSTTMKVLKD